MWPRIGGSGFAILTFSSAALHLKPRDGFLQWSARQVRERRHLIAQNSRFLVLASTGRWPNLASRVLMLAYARLTEDWSRQYGTPVLLVETFVDPQRFHGTCYRAANWQALGATQGFARCGRDYYLDQEHPKELWVYGLGRGALERLRAPTLDEALREGCRPLPPPVPVPTAQMNSLVAFLRRRVVDPRDPHGVRHPIADAAHTVKANCRQLTQEQGAESLFFFKGNQPQAFAKAKPLLAGNTPPSDAVDRQRSWTG